MTSIKKKEGGGVAPDVADRAHDRETPTWSKVPTSNTFDISHAVTQEKCTRVVSTISVELRKV